jgi:hypothetical protein
MTTDDSKLKYAQKQREALVNKQLHCIKHMTIEVEIAQDIE